MGQGKLWISTIALLAASCAPNSSPQNTRSAIPWGPGATSTGGGTPFTSVGGGDKSSEGGTPLTSIGGGGNSQTPSQSSSVDDITVMNPSVNAPTNNYTAAEKRSLGILPDLVSSNAFTYGLYPQSVVDDAALTSALNSLGSSAIGVNGWYLYRGTYYAKLKATPKEAILDSDYQEFENGDRIFEGREYWFEVKPITWRILSTSGNTYFVSAGRLLDRAPSYYGSTSNRSIDGKTIYPNNYLYSELRAFMNDSFYYTAFALGDSYIQLTHLDNSTASTATSSNPYVCEDTTDKIFAPSYQQYSRQPGINSAGGRELLVTDYARARGAWYGKASAHEGQGNYWTRSPNGNQANNAHYISYKGSINGDYLVTTKTLCIRPAMTFTYSF